MNDVDGDGAGGGRARRDRLVGRDGNAAPPADHVIVENRYF